MINLRNELIIKDGLINNNNFIIENNDILTIDRVLKAPYYNSYFECICILGESIDKTNIMVDRLVYNKYNNQIHFLNTRNIHESVISVFKINGDEIIYLYPFGEDKILIICDKKGE